VCDVGTDCEDCGIRDYCYECPAACQERNAQTPEQACMQSMWNDGACDTNCANAECGFNDCSRAQIATACMATQAAAGLDYASAPLVPPRASVALRISEPNLRVDPDLNTMLYALGVEATLEWDDARLRGSPCHDVLPHMLTTLAAGEALGYGGAFWFPEAKFGNAIRESDGSPATAVELGGLLSPNTGAMPALLADGAVRSTQTRALQLEQAHFTFVRYPFDHHDIVFDLEVQGANLSGCGTDLVAQLRTQQLLPLASSWYIDGEIRGEHPTRAGEDAVGICRLRVPIRRSSTVYIVKQLVPLIVIVMGALLALQMNPTIPPLLGGRTSMLIFAMVLISMKSGNAAGLGEPIYLIWPDWLRVGQFVILLAALFDTIVVHRLIRHNEPERAARLDKVARLALPFGVYPTFILSMVLYGLEHDAAAIAVFVLGTAAILVACGMHMNHERIEHARVRSMIVRAVSRGKLDSEESATLLQTAFRTFDADKNGVIDAVELTGVMAVLFPNLSRRQRVAVCAEMNERVAALDEDNFVEAIQRVYAERKLRSPPKEVLLQVEKVKRGHAKHSSFA
jgi:hypothetical protein